MNTINQTRYSLKFNEIKALNLLEGERLSILCKSGSGWITAKDDKTDYVVEEGQSFELPHHMEDVLIQSLSEFLELEVCHGSCA